jgi:hypothetical protein
MTTINITLASGDAGLWPAIEANQGLISILALCAALAVALLEYRRALQVERDRGSRFRETIVGLLIVSLGHIDEALSVNAQAAQHEGAAGLAIWRRNADLTQKVIVALRPAAPQDPALLRLLVEIECAYDPASGARTIIDSGETKRVLRAARTRIADLLMEFRSSL